MGSMDRISRCITCNATSDDFNMVPVFTTETVEGAPVPYTIIISAVLNVSITEENDLPKQICVKCQAMVRKFYAFQVESIKVLCSFASAKDFHATQYANVTAVPSANNITKATQTEDIFMYPCEFCPQTFDTNPELKRHRHTHNSSEYKCRFCERMFSRLDGLQSHLSNFHPESNMQWSNFAQRTKCTVCGETFNRIYRLKEHMQVVHKYFNRNEISSDESDEGENDNTDKDDNELQKDDVVNYPCEFCSSILETNIELKKHRTNHNIKEMKCRFCQLIFGRLDSLQCHLIVDHPESQMHLSHFARGHTCKVCGKVFSRICRLKKHIKTDHKKKGNGGKKTCMPIKSAVDGCSKNVNQAICDDGGYVLKDAPKIKNAITDSNFEEFAQKGNSIQNPNDDPLSNKSYKLFFENCDTGVKENIGNVIQTPVLSIVIKEEEQVNTLASDISENLSFSDNNEDAIISDVTNKKRKPNVKVASSHVDKQCDSSTSLECNICNKTFANKNSLRRHVQEHTQAKKFSCTQCLLVFQRLDHLKQHIKRHLKFANLCCPTCGQNFQTMDKYEDHIKMHDIEARKSDPNSDMSQFCEICNKSYSGTKYFRAHMAKHGPPTIECNRCDKKFYTTRDVTKHMQTHTKDANERPFLCSECGKSFKKAEGFACHVRRHRGEKNFVCNFCPKSFVSSSERRLHHRYHTEEKLVNCAICLKGFYRAGSLKIHMRTHTGEKPYKCLYCDRRFAQRNDMNVHVRRHTGDRFQCDMCPQEFIHGYHLTRHKLKIHGIVTNVRNARVEKVAIKPPENGQ